MSWQWSMMENLKRNWLVFSKLTWGIWQILTRAFKRWDLFIQSRKRANLKFTEELCIMKNGEWWKIKRGIDLLIHNWHNSLTNIDPSTQMPHSTICTLMGSFWPKYVMFELKKYTKVMLDGNEDGCKIWRKTDLCFPKWHEEFGNLSQAEK